MEKKNLSFFAGNDVADEVFAGDRRIVFSKDMSLTNMAKNIAVPPIKIHHDIDAAGFHKADLADRRAGPEDDLIFLECPLLCTQAGEQDGDLVFGDPPEE